MALGALHIIAQAFDRLSRKRGLDHIVFVSAAVVRCGKSQGTELPKCIAEGDDVCV